MKKKNKCLYCQKEFSRQLSPSNIRQGRGKFCSRKCASIAHTTALIKSCLVCNKEFKTHPCRIKKGFGRFCSRKCKMVAMKGRIPWNKGKRGIWSIKQRKHLSELNKLGIIGNKGKKFSEEHKRRIGESNKGRIVSEETRRKISEANKGKHANKRHSLETKKKISESQKGEKNHFWQGGISKINGKIRYSDDMKKWRVSILKRDNFTCQLCGIYGGKLIADHVKPFAYFPKLRLELSNGRTLCVNCHKSTPTYGRKVFQVYPTRKLFKTKNLPLDNRLISALI